MTNTSVARYRQRAASTGRALFIQTGRSRVAARWKAIVFDPSRAQLARRAPAHVGAGIESTAPAGSTGVTAAAGAGVSIRVAERG